MSVTPQALALAETSHRFDELAAVLYAAGMRNAGDRMLAKADRAMDAALDLPLTND